MINLYCSYPTIGLTNRRRQMQNRNNIVSFGNPAKDMKEIAGIIISTTEVKNCGFALKRIIRLGEFYRKYPKEVINAMNEIINYHVADDLKLKHFDSENIINQICTTIEENKIVELQDILKKIAVYKFWKSVSQEHS